MNDASKLADLISKHPLNVYATAIITVVQFGAWALSTTEKMPLTVPQAIIVHTSLFTLCLAIVGVYKLVKQNQAYKSTFDNIHELNHLYRQTLAGTTAKLIPVDSNNHERINNVLLSAERDTLRSAVRIISGIFNKLTSRDTTTTIWLFDNETNVCNEYISCKDNENALRKKSSRETYDVSENDAFSNCKEAEGKCCHFLASNLKKLRKRKRYKDQRTNNGEFYQAILTVPIRYVHENNENRIGYLQIDQKAANYLNNVEHLFILAACADQMYNFLSIIRRNFLFN